MDLHTFHFGHSQRPWHPVIHQASRYSSPPHPIMTFKSFPDPWIIENVPAVWPAKKYGHRGFVVEVCSLFEFIDLITKLLR